MWKAAQPTVRPSIGGALLTYCESSLRSLQTSLYMGPGRWEIGCALMSCACSADMDTGRGSSGREKWNTVQEGRK